MVLFDAHPWIRFTTGLIVGCWLGVFVGCGIMMMLAGRRLRQLEAANQLLREKLRMKERSRQPAMTGTGPSLVTPAGVNRPARAPLRVMGRGR